LPAYRRCNLQIERFFLRLRISYRPPILAWNGRLSFWYVDHVTVLTESIDWIKPEKQRQIATGELLTTKPTNGNYHVRTEEGEAGWGGKPFSIVRRGSPRCGACTIGAALGLNPANLGETGFQ
jgi:hypothetical protein